MIQADAGHASEGEKVGFIRVGAGADKAGDPSGNAPFVDRCVSLVLDEGYGTKDGVAGGGFDETKEGIRKVFWYGKGSACTWKENEWER